MKIRVLFSVLIILLLVFTTAYAVDVPLLSEQMDYFVNVQGGASVVPYGKASSLRPATEREKKLLNWNDPIAQLYVADGILLFRFRLAGEPTEYGRSALPGLSLDAYVYSYVNRRQTERIKNITLGSVSGNILNATVDLMNIMTKGQVLMVNFKYNIGSSARTAGFGKRKSLDLIKQFDSDYSSATNANTIARIAIVYLPAVRLALKSSQESVVIGAGLEQSPPDQFSLIAKVTEKYSGDPEIEYPVSFLVPSGNLFRVFRDKTNLKGEVYAYVDVPEYQIFAQEFKDNTYQGSDVIRKASRIQAVALSAGQEHTAGVTLNVYVLSPRWVNFISLSDELEKRQIDILLDRRIPRLFTMRDNQLLMVLNETYPEPAVAKEPEELVFVAARIDGLSQSADRLLTLNGEEEYPVYRLIEDGYVFVVHEKEDSVFLSSTETLSGEIIVFRAGRQRAQPFKIIPGQALELRLGE
ncbi:MAG: hypothetical protein ABIH39_08040 [Candidatus Margulisiibacteriota bacterium]